MRPPVTPDAETGNKLLPQNSDLKEAEKDQHAKRSPLEVLSKISVPVTLTMLLIGDSVIQFINPRRMAPQNENLQKICVPGVTVIDLCHWLSHAPASHTINHVTLHTRINSCPSGPFLEADSGPFLEAEWSDLIALCCQVFPQACLSLSSIIPAQGRHKLKDAMSRQISTSSLPAPMLVWSS